MVKDRDEKIAEGIIDGYRECIKERYDYDNLNEKYNLPTSIDRPKAEEIKDYFLDYIYPNVEKRKILDEAFGTLDEYLRRPAKLLNILVASSFLIFRYGKSLPQIFGTGIKALKSFRSATAFENELIETAKLGNSIPPYSVDEINTLISSLPRHSVEDFLEEMRSLFEVLYDRDLVNKIIDIGNELVKKMRKKPKLYSIEEVNGIELGIQIIQEGDALFASLKSDERGGVFELIMTVENDVLKGIFENGNL